MIPVRGVGHIDVLGWELQDLPGGPYSGVWIRLDLQQLWSQTVVRVLRSRGDVDLQLSYKH